MHQAQNQWLPVHTHTHTHHKHTNTHTTHTHTHTTNTHTYTHTHTKTHTHLHTYIHTHTHTHEHKNTHTTHTRYGCTGRWVVVPSHSPLLLRRNMSHQRQTTVHTTALEPAVPASERQYIYAFDRAAIGNGRNIFDSSQYFVIYCLVACRDANESLCKFCDKKPSSSLILYTDRADKGGLTGEAVQV